jgi:long-chain acyl-CoA synthetase
LSHANLAFQIDAILEANVVTENDHMLVPLPLHHVYPFVMGMLSPLTLGLTVVLPQSLTGPQLVRALKEGEVSVIVGVPRLYSALYSSIEVRAKSGGKMAAALFGFSAGLSTWVRRKTGLDAGRVVMRPLRERLGPWLRILASGGAPLDQGLAQKLEGMGWRIVIGYGLTETAPLLALKRADGKKLGSVGQPMSGIDVRLDPSAMPGEDKVWRSERPLTSEPYREGEILARGPGVFSGYLNLPEETEEVLTKDGWFRTRDTGELQPFRPRIGMLLDRFPVPVVPVFIRGTHEAMPPGKAWPRPKKLTITFGKPLDPRELEQRSEGEQPQDRIVRALYEHVAELGSDRA